MKKLNLIDGTNIFYICWSVYRKKLEDCGLEVSEESYNELYNIFFMKIKQFFDVPNVVVAFEGENSRAWRKRLLPEYKGTRPTAEEDKSLVHIKPLMNKVIELLSLLPIKVMKVDNCEADDVIFTLANSAWKIEKGDVEITIISSDEDMTQIPLRLDPEKVRVFHPCTKLYRECNPQIVIQKILSGDSSDNIKFKNGIGGKSALKIANGNLKLFKRFFKTREDFDRVMTIAKVVDSRYFPKEFRDKIISTANFNFWNNDILPMDLKMATIRSIFTLEGATYCLGFLERVLPKLYCDPLDPKLINRWAPAEDYKLPENVYELFEDEHLTENTEERKQAMLGLKKEIEHMLG